MLFIFLKFGMVILGRRVFWKCFPNLFEMSCSDVNVSCPFFKWWTIVLLFLPSIFCTLFQTLFIGVWQFNLETKLRQKVRRFCFNVLRAFALKMRKLPRLSDVGCFPNCRSAFLRLLMASLQSSLNHGLPGCFGFAEVYSVSAEKIINDGFSYSENV